MVSVSKFTSSSNQPCMTSPTLINLNPDEYYLELRYYRVMVYWDTCNGSCNALYDHSDRIRAPNEAEDVNLVVFNMITKTNKNKNIYEIYIMQM